MPNVNIVLTTGPGPGIGVERRQSTRITQAQREHTRKKNSIEMPWDRPLKTPRELMGQSNHLFIPCAPGFWLSHPILRRGLCRT